MGSGRESGKGVQRFPWLLKENHRKELRACDFNSFKGLRKIDKSLTERDPYNIPWVSSFTSRFHTPLGDLNRTSSRSQTKVASNSVKRTFPLNATISRTSTSEKYRPTRHEEQITEVSATLLTLWLSKSILHSMHGDIAKSEAEQEKHNSSLAPEGWTTQRREGLDAS